jgi:RNase P subunit RPR2
VLFNNAGMNVWRFCRRGLPATRLALVLRAYHANALEEVPSDMASGYCMKCKAQRDIQNAKQITMKNGRPATEGTCVICGTKIFKIGAAK